jgi:hypothetical protein
MPKVKPTRTRTHTSTRRKKENPNTNHEYEVHCQEVLKEVITIARDLPHSWQIKYFKNNFLVLVQRGQRVMSEVTFPTRDQLKTGQCNIPPVLTGRSQLAKNAPPTPCRRLVKKDAYFCNLHAHIAESHKLPVWSTNGKSYPSFPPILENDLKLSLSEEPRLDVDNVPDTSFDLDDNVLDDVEYQLDDPCCFEDDNGKICDTEATFLGFCDKHQKLSLCYDQLVTDQNKADLKKLITLEKRIDCSLEYVMDCCAVDGTLNLKFKYVQNLNVAYNISLRNSMCRAIGIGQPPCYKNATDRALEFVPNWITRIFNNVNNEVTLVD